MRPSVGACGFVDKLLMSTMMVSRCVDVDDGLLGSDGS